MPIYEYACEACGHEFEREQRITEDPIKRCPECRAPRARRLISRTSFLLKGGGWYSDLYSSARPTKKDAQEGGDATAKQKSVEKTSEPSDKAASKDAAKPDKKSGSGPKAAA